MRGDTVVAAGDASVELGHRIGRADGPPEGAWVTWRWDGDRLEAAADVFGTYPLYYAGDERRILLSPAIDRLLERGVDRRLDEDAVAAFLAIGY